MTFEERVTAEGRPLDEGDMPNAVVLKPCPFCGATRTLEVTSAAELNCEDKEEFSAWPHSDSYAVMCDAHQPGGPGGCGASGGFFLSEAEAVAAWNRRASFLELMLAACA